MITRKDLEDLKKDFEEFCEQAQPNQFPLLIILEVKMGQTLAKLDDLDSIAKQEELRSMCWSIYQLLGNTEKAKKFEKVSQ